MLFSSMTFIFLFMPFLLTAYYFIRPDFRNGLLLIFSIFFYAWGEPTYVVIMLLTIAINYLGAVLIDKYGQYKKWILWGTIIADLSFLFYFKYFNFVMSNINAAFNMDIKFLDVIMPIGISFYTFQAMSYLIDVYRGEVQAQKNIYKLALYISLFPQLVAGPIVKYHDVADQIDKRTISLDNISYGTKRFIIGLAKKMLLANTMGAIADKVFNQPVEQLDTLTAWIGAIAYSFQIFYDFSGYSDMAIGLGAIFGFKFLENFNYPYISKSITEFWRRWHISLSTWFKEYLYIPLGGNRISQKRTYINLFIVFLATGIWHGAEWTFIVWGVWHGFFIIMEKLTGWHKKKGCWKLSLAQHVYTILVFLLGWVLFRAENITYAKQYLGKMLFIGDTQNIKYYMGYYIDNIEIITFIAALICSVPLFKSILNIQNKFGVLAINVYLLTLFVLSVSCIASDTYNQFIYFRF